ncbi:MAG: c-type cytochrome [Verrucomicrobiaceae bacterium]|nr:c-type cytochrome [Verrucomicrobiaceae bacterium]
MHILHRVLSLHLTALACGGPVLAAADAPPIEVNFQKLREQNVRKIDSQLSLDLLSNALATTQDPSAQAALLRGILQGLEGRRGLTPPKTWAHTAALLEASDSPEVRQLGRQLSLIFGDESARQHALTTVINRNASPDERRANLRSLVTGGHPQLQPSLAALLDDPDLQLDAIRAHGSLDDPSVPTLLLGRYPKLSPQAKRTVLETLCSRKSYATALLAALKDSTLPKSDIPAYIARTLAGLLGDSFTAVYGDLAALSKDKAELIAQYQRLLTPERLATAKAANGRMIFQAVCAACHKLYGEGGAIGPDLTGSNRADLNYILLNMIDPSADIPDAYKLITLTTKSGQIFAGTLAEEDDQRVVLNMVGQKSTVVKADIATRVIAPVSMMPEGLLPALNNSQVIDLVKYLQTTEQVAPAR